MDAICFHIGSRPVYWYGVMVAIAFLACIAHWTVLGKKEGRPSSFGSDLGIWLMLAGIAGARAGYVLANLPNFLARPWDIVRVDQGGLIFYGGFICACAAAIIFARVKHERLWPFSDFVVTALPLGHAIGRIGCFLNGCCYGTPSDLPWSVHVQGLPRHPTQLYGSLLNFAIYLVLLRAYARRTREGRVFALYLMLYPAGRFMLESLRGDERTCFFGVSIAQYVSLVLFAVGLVLWFILPVQAPRHSPPHCNGKHPGRAMPWNHGSRRT